MKQFKLSFQAIFAVIAITIGLYAITPVTIARAWDEGVRAFANCQGWKVTADPETFRVNNEVRWMPVTIIGTGESPWNGDTEHSYTVTVKWRKQVRQCTWRGCTPWHNTNDFYEESNSGTVRKPNRCEPKPSPSETPCPTPTPDVTPSPTPSESPTPAPTPTPEPSPDVPATPPPDNGTSGNRSALANDNLQCPNTDFDAVFDVKRDGNGVKDVKVTFTFNGSTKEAMTNENGRAKVQFPIANGTLTASANDFPSQAQTITAPTGCPAIGGTEEVGRGGYVLGADTLAATGSQDTYLSLGLMLAGLVVTAGGAYAYFQTQKIS